MKPEDVADILHHFGGGVYAKEARIPAGHVLMQHAHDFDHLSILAKGRALVGVDGDVAMYTGPACILIKAGKQHSVQSVTDVTWFCVHSTDETDPAKVDEVLIRG